MTKNHGMMRSSEAKNAPMRADGAHERVMSGAGGAFSFRRMKQKTAARVPRIKSES